MHTHSHIQTWKQTEVHIHIQLCTVRKDLLTKRKNTNNTNNIKDILVQIDKDCHLYTMTANFLE